MDGTVYGWMHTVADVLTALIDAGLTIEMVHEHDAVLWQMFSCLKKGDDGLYRWPDKAWFPLGWSLRARKPA